MVHLVYRSMVDVFLRNFPLAIAIATINDEGNAATSP
jgi:hypothetical protein